MAADVTDQARQKVLANAAGAEVTASVVIATIGRPTELDVCLQHLQRQTVLPAEVIVVDASDDDRSRNVVAAYPGVHYLRNDAGPGTLPLSRRIGFDASVGDIVAFLDDDAYATPDWLVELCRAYEPGVGGVGGQALNGQPGEECAGVDQIGRVLANGRVTGNFAADPGRIISVDHLIGCNMSFDRRAIDASGGLVAWHAGISSVREDLLICLRLRESGFELRYNPRASVRHVGAPQLKGRRFDLRYQYASSRNHAFVMTHVYGF